MRWITNEMQANYLDNASVSYEQKNIALCQTSSSSPPPGRTLRLLSVCPGLRAAWAQISSPRMAPCRPSPPAPTTKSPPTTTTTTTCSTTPSARPRTPPPSSLPLAAWPATGRHAITEPPPPPTSATTTTPPCHAGSPCPLRPTPTGAPPPDRSATPSCPRPRSCHWPSAILTCSSRPLPPLHRCPPVWPPRTSPVWEGCPLWCQHRTRPDRWSNTSQRWLNSAADISQWNNAVSVKGSAADPFLKGTFKLLFSKELH